MLPVCQPCRDRIVPLQGTLCRICGEKLFSPHLEGEGGALCGICRRVPPRFRKAVAYGAYDGELRELLHLFKYGGVRAAGPLLGRLLGHALAGTSVPSSAVLVPVPLWRNKRQARGFNQAEAIARAFLSSKPSGSIQLNTSSLVKTRQTASQTGLTRHQRRANVRGAFAVTGADKIRGRSILLVDDVMTTGTTVNECARALLRAGAKEVFVATVARATREVGLKVIDQEIPRGMRGTSA